MRESLEVNSQSPLYSQLADAILNAIKAGEFKSGDKIPSPPNYSTSSAYPSATTVCYGLSASLLPTLSCKIGRAHV